MFRSVFLKSLRDYRVAILGWGVGMGLTLAFTMATVSQFTATPEARAELAAVAAQFTWNAAAVAVDTVGGYAMFKIGTFIFILGVWPLLAAARALRGEEERGSMDVLLSLPLARVRVAIEKIAAIWTALLAMGALIGVIAYAAGQKFGADFGLGDALLYGLDLALVCAVVAGVALVLSQLMTEAASAARWTAGLLVLFIVVDMVHRVFPDADWISRLSPIYYFNLSKPLVPSYGTDAGALVVLAALAVVLAAVAVAVFARRDIGAAVALPWASTRAPAPTPAAALPVGDWSLRSVYARSLATIVVPTLWWAFLLAALGAWMVVAIQQIGKQLEEIVSQSPIARQLFESIGGQGATLNATFLATMFQMLPILLMAFVVTQVSAWASDEENGRLEMVLATPQPRLTVILGRFAALSTATIFIGLAVFAGTIVVSRVAGLALDGGNLAAASLGMIPLGLLIGGIGYLGAGWLRQAADTGLLSFLLVLWFFVGFIGKDLGWPDATLRISPFYYYGSPLLQGLQAANVLGLLAVGAVALAIGALRFTRKDIAA